MSEIEPVLPQKFELPVIVDQEQFTIELQNYYSGHSATSKKLEWTSERIQSVIKLLEDYNSAKSQRRRPTNKQYHHANKYDVMNVGNQKVLIMKRKEISDSVVQIIPSEEYYQKILDAHIATGHGRRDKIVHALRDKYVVPIFAITIFLNLCKTSLSKKSFPKTGIVVKPLISDDFNRRGQIDLVDFQTSPDGEYKWLLQYQDHLTTFCFLRPLKSKQAKEVAVEILKIFLEVGCPHILQSDNGREFTASVLKEIISLWPACKVVHGRPRYPQSQGSIERSNQDIKNMIRAWMVDNKSTDWSIGCYFVQFQKKSSYHSTIARTPYKALFGEDPKLGLSSTYLSKNIISKLETEEDMEIIFEEINNDEKQNSQKDQEANEQEEVPTVGQEIVIQDQNNVLNSSESLPQVRVEPVIIADIIIHRTDYEQKKISAVSKEIFTPESPDQVNPEILSTSLNSPITNAKLNTLNSEQGKVHDNVDEGVVTLDQAIISNKFNTLTNIDDIPITIEKINNLMCYICNKEASGAHTCIKCKQVVHTICGVVSEENEGYGSQLLCNLCLNELSIVQERKESHKNLKRVAEKMIATSSKKFKDISVGSPVLVEVPKGGPLDSKNLIGKVLEKKNELYRVGTAFGIIKDWMPRNAVLSSPRATLLNDIPEVTLPLRTVASMSSSFGGQGMKHCNCKKFKKGQCVSNKCNYKKAKVLCNSRCHSSLTCNNK